jgi:hypothetical protein
VQILFAFLLTLAFTQRFPSLDAFQRATYVVTLLCAVLAAALFTAPAALHRSLFQRGAKARIVQVSSRLATVRMGVPGCHQHRRMPPDWCGGRGAPLSTGRTPRTRCLGRRTASRSGREPRPGRERRPGNRRRACVDPLLSRAPDRPTRAGDIPSVLMAPRDTHRCRQQWR